MPKYIVNKIFVSAAAIYYYYYKRASLRISDPRFYEYTDLESHRLNQNTQIIQ